MYTGRFRYASPDRYGLLKEYARENRKNMTLAEQVLWDLLKNKAIGHRFYRQYVIADYIVDFYCQDFGLIIEVDGGYHSEPRQEDDDEIRTNRLQSMGFHVIRFTNEEVLFEHEYVLETIQNCLDN